jgi:Calx-beta domain-containing protein
MLQSRVHTLSLISVLMVIAAAVSLCVIRPGTVRAWKFASAHPPARPVSNFTVTNTNDSGPGSLRQAILDANANSGSDQITFSIGSGLQTIAPTSQLPDITDPVVIDGTTQPGFAGVPIIELSGGGAPAAPLLTLKAGNSTIRGLVIDRCKQGAISILTAGGNHIEGNYLGTDSTGNAKTNSNGTLIAVNDAPNNIIGGTTAGTRNIISGTTGYGIAVFGNNATGNLIEGNYIGLNATGSSGLGNSQSGIALSSSNSTVGGTAPEARNVISGNAVSGVVIQNSTSTSGNVIQGNYIGCDVTASYIIPNTQAGIALSTLSTNNLIGGLTPGARNIIGGNNIGISVSESNGKPDSNVIQGNYIGVGPDGMTPLSNQVEGIHVAGATNTTIGGTQPGAGNTIAFNGVNPSSGNGTGVAVLGSTGNSIRGNSVFSNGLLGIDLDNDGVTANDNGDADTGGNNRQNFPIITTVVAGAGQTTINGTLNSTANATFQLDFYANTTCDPSGNGEGATPFGSGSVNTDASGNGSFSVIVNSVLPGGRTITGTATDAVGNTSEFSACDPTNAMGSVQFSQMAVQVSEDVGFVPLTVVRTGGSHGTLSVDYYTTDVSAIAGQDYVATSGTLVFNDGETSKTFNVPIIDDAVNEANEWFVAGLRNGPAVDSIGIIPGELVTIQDHSVPITLSINSINVSEGDTGTTPAVFTVSVSALTSRTMSVDYFTGGNNATSGVDFQPVSGTVSFAPRVATQPITVPVIGDTIDEVNETFRVVLTNPVGATVSGAPGVGTIIDDDPPPSVTVNDVSVLEGSGTGLTFAQFTLTLSAPSGKSPCVQISTSPGTATPGSDYQPVGEGSIGGITSPPAFVTFDPGASSTTFSVAVIQDTVVEPDETFFINLRPCNTDIVIARAQAMATIINDDPPATLQFDAPGYTVNEGIPDVTVTVTRTGYLAQPSTVVYQTADNSGANNCSVISNAASSRCDYLTTIGTLSFAANETSKTITIPIVDDSYAEHDETFNIFLSNPTGALLGTPQNVPIVIKDNDSANGPNPVDQGRFFVRQHYLDFLNREPDQSGWDFWTNQITSCGADTQCTDIRRINVSASFFLAIEFQQTGYLVERFYKVAYGDTLANSALGSNHQLMVPVIRFVEFLKDTQRIGQGVVVLQPGWEQALEANKQAYALEFVQSSRFAGAFSTALSPTQFVDQLNQRAGNVLSTSERATAIGLFGGAANSSNVSARALAVRQVAEDPDLYNAEFNRAFVLTQYFGYMRRNPNDVPDADYTGFEFWLTKLNQFNGDYIGAEMVKAFISSGEYRQRFGP